jgi:multisubunit Na+/H+ antiporter MnhC subunit
MATATLISVVGVGLIAVLVTLLYVIGRQSDPRDLDKIQRDDSWGSREGW